jgi:arylsulfatase A-like enzyme
VAAGSTSDQTICFTDMLATFAAIVDVPLADEAGPDSFNILPALQGTDDRPIRDALVIRSGGHVMTIRMGPWKLITALGSGGFSEPKRVTPAPGDPAGQLYNLVEDIGETHNLYAQRPEIVQRLTKKLSEIRSRDRSRPARPVRGK